MEPKTPSGITVTYKDGTSLSLESHIALEEDRQKSKEVNTNLKCLQKNVKNKKKK